MLENFVSDAFEYKKLTEEEQKSRGILGRLVGVIADTKEPTRNGRKYSSQLWENVFENPIMKEKITNRCCFGELNHPADRSEVDLERVAICLAEYPKKDSEGRLHGVFDILSTPNGRILKALCDYGCKIGISSRGQGDLITDDDGEEAVDPDTYDCECFDAVIIPGVEVARLKYVTESLQKERSLSTVLTEELATASHEARKIMKETLDMLKIDLNEAKKEEKIAEVEEPTAEIEVAESDDLAVDFDFSEDDAAAEAEENPADDASEVDSEEILDDAEDDEEDADIESNDADEEDSRTDEEIFLDFLANNFDEKQIKKVCDILDIEVDADAEEVESEEVESDETESDDAEDDEKITDEEAEEAESDDINIDDEVQDDAEEDTEEANDDGTDVLVNSLKEALTKAADMESSIKSLQEELAVRDANVLELTEECNRYKTSITRLSTLAKSNKELKENISNLEESLSQKENLIESQKARISRLAQDRKDKISKDNEISSLNESLNKAKDDYEDKVKTLTEQLSAANRKAEKTELQFNENLAKAVKLTESYKNLANTAINSYIEVKADMLGITSKDIKRKLGESYTINDINQVCNDLKSYNLNVSRLPFSVDRKVSVRVNESKSPVSVKKPSIYEDDDIDSTLLKLAALDD